MRAGSIFTFQSGTFNGRTLDPNQSGPAIKEIKRAPTASDAARLEAAFTQFANLKKGAMQTLLRASEQTSRMPADVPFLLDLTGTARAGAVPSSAMDATLRA